MWCRWASVDEVGEGFAIESCLTLSPLAESKAASVLSSGESTTHILAESTQSLQQPDHLITLWC